MNNETLIQILSPSRCGSGFMFHFIMDSIILQPLAVYLAYLQ